MNYYNQTDKNEVQEMEKDLIENGFDVAVSTGTCQIIHETSKYNKYMKWHAITTFENGGSSSNYYKSKPEALRDLTKRRPPLPIGNRMSLMHIIII